MLPGRQTFISTPRAGTPARPYNALRTMNYAPTAETREPALNLIQGPCWADSRDFVAVDWPTTSYKLRATGYWCYHELRTLHYAPRGTKP